MPENLAGWLEYLGRIHPKTIEMGLDRVLEVARRMDLRPGCKIVTVTGTNGKGSVCAMLESILAYSGFSVGCYTSPHLTRFNERIRIARREADDERICAVFGEVEAARGEIPLTYFEFTTLAALRLFVSESVDIAVLEVGLGGRLDAVNAFDADCAVITSIGLDHMDYLGETREQIGFEKAGVMRPGRPAIIAEPEIPRTVLEHAQNIGAELKILGQDFSFDEEDACWNYQGIASYFLPRPALYGKIQLRNASTAIAALEALGIPLEAKTLAAGIIDLDLKGRFQVVKEQPRMILDVSHNPPAAKVLAENLALDPCSGRTFAVFSMLSDKDIAGVIREMKGKIDCWHVAPLLEARAAQVEALLAALEREGERRVFAHRSVDDAFQRACEEARENDRILIFGSFHTVARAMELM